MYVVSRRGNIQAAYDEGHGRFFLKDTRSGGEVTLTEDEFNVAGTALKSDHGFELLQRNLEYAGIVISDKELPDGAADQFGRIKKQVPENSLTAFLDTTTVFNTLACVDHPKVVQPAALLDLSVFTFAALCFDHIVVQPFTRDVLLRRLRDDGTVIVMEYPDDKFVSDYLHSFRADITNNMRDINVAAYEAAWAKLLRKKPGVIVIDPRVVHRYHASPHYWDGVYVGAYLNRQLVEPLPGSVEAQSPDPDLNEFLSIQTSCVLFNDSLAGALNLPYLTSSFRNCVYSKVLGHKIRGPLADADDEVFKRPHVLDVVMARNAPKNFSPSARRSLYTDYFTAPFLLGLVLMKMKKPEDYWDVLRKYRDQLAPLRKRILRDKDKWEGREENYARELMKPLTDLRGGKRVGAADLAEDVESSLTLASPFPSSDNSKVSLVSLGVKLVKLLKPHAFKFYRRELYVLNNLADEAKALRALELTVKRIWGQTWGPGGAALLKHLASTDTREFIRPGGLA